MAGGDIDCRLARGVLTDLTLPSLARHRHPASTSTNRVAPLGDSSSDLRL
jgi:hypothetical protein